MAAKTNEKTTVTEETAQAVDTAVAPTDAEMTNVRHQAVRKLVAELKELAQDDKNRGFDIGDLVEAATTKHRVRVADLVKEVGIRAL